MLEAEYSLVVINVKPQTQGEKINNMASEIVYGFQVNL